MRRECVELRIRHFGVERHGPAGRYTHGRKAAAAKKKSLDSITFLSISSQDVTKISVLSAIIVLTILGNGLVIMVWVPTMFYFWFKSATEMF